MVARSKLNASSINLGSLQAVPVKATPRGAGFASNPGGNGAAGAFCERGARCGAVALKGEVEQ